MNYMLSHAHTKGPSWRLSGDAVSSQPRQEVSRGRLHPPFSTIGAAFNDHAFHRATGRRLQLQNLCQRHRGLSQGQQVVALATVTNSAVFMGGPMRS